MKRFVASIAGAAAFFSSMALAEPLAVVGSDTLAEVMSESIALSDLQSELVYAGGGSGKAEEALLAGKQGLAPMSKPFSANGLATAQANGITIVPHTVALDGIAIVVNAANPTGRIDFATLKKIFSCEISQWEEVAGSGKTGAIHVIRRDDISGTTQTFTNFIKPQFGACATVMLDEVSQMNAINSDADAITYAGLNGLSDGNRAIPVAKDDASAASLPTPQSVRDGSYPMSRGLFVYESKDKLSLAESKLMANILNPSFIYPIVQKHGFITVE